MLRSHPRQRGFEKEAKGALPGLPALVISAFYRQASAPSPSLVNQPATVNATTTSSSTTSTTSTTKRSSAPFDASPPRKGKQPSRHKKLPKLDLSDASHHLPSPPLSSLSSLSSTFRTPSASPTLGLNETSAAHGGIAEGTSELVRPSPRGSPTAYTPRHLKREYAGQPNPQQLESMCEHKPVGVKTIASGREGKLRRSPAMALRADSSPVLHQSQSSWDLR